MWCRRFRTAYAPLRAPGPVSSRRPLFLPQLSVHYRQLFLHFLSSVPERRFFRRPLPYLLLSAGLLLFWSRFQPRLRIYSGEFRHLPCLISFCSLSKNYIIVPWQKSIYSGKRFAEFSNLSACHVRLSGTSAKAISYRLITLSIYIGIHKVRKLFVLRRTLWLKGSRGLISFHN